MSYGDDYSGGGGYQSEKDLPAKAIVGAIVGALIGLAIWAAGIIFLDVEVGWVAWAIGGLVAFGCRAGGTNGGKTAGVFCAVLAVLAILGGKVVAVKMMVPDMLREQLSEVFSVEQHSEHMKQAQEYAKVDKTDEGAVRQFLYVNDYSEAPAPDAVTQAEIEEFKQEQAPALERYATAQPSYESWREERMRESEEMIQQFTNSITITDALKNTTGMMDIIFILLGVATAYKWGGRMED